MMKKLLSLALLGCLLSAPVAQAGLKETLKELFLPTVTDVKDVTKVDASIVIAGVVLALAYHKLCPKGKCAKDVSKLG